MAKTVGKVPILATRKTKGMCGLTMLSTDDRLRLTSRAVKKLRIDIYCDSSVQNNFEISCWYWNFGDVNRLWYLVQPSWCEARRLLAALQPDTAESVVRELVVQASDVVDRRQAAPHSQRRFELYR